MHYKAWFLQQHSNTRYRHNASFGCLQQRRGANYTKEKAFTATWKDVGPSFIYLLFVSAWNFKIIGLKNLSCWNDCTWMLAVRLFFIWLLMFHNFTKIIDREDEHLVKQNSSCDSCRSYVLMFCCSCSAFLKRICCVQTRHELAYLELNINGWNLIEC